MEITSINCTSCGAPIKVPPDVDHFNCIFCGTSLVVQRDEGYVSLKVAEQVSKSFQDVGQQTQSTIRESAEITKMELIRMQLNNQVSSLKIQLQNVQAEMRTLRRQKADKRIKSQLRDLAYEESSLISQINDLNTRISATYPASARSTPTISPAPLSLKQKRASRPLLKGCLASFVVLIAGSVVCGLPAQLIDEVIFKVPASSTGSGAETSGPMFSIAAMVITLLMIAGFIYGLNPKAKLWASLGNWIKSRFQRMRKPEPNPQEPASITKNSDPANLS